MPYDPDNDGDQHTPQKSLWDRTLDWFSMQPSNRALNKASGEMPKPPTTEPASESTVDFVKRRWKRMTDPEVDALGQKKKKKAETK